MKTLTPSGGRKPSGAERVLCLVILLVVGALGACREPEVPPKVVVVLVDRSGSTVGDRDVYRRCLTEIRASLQGGDRLVVAPITSASGTDFVTSLDYSLPEPVGEQGFMDEPVEYRRRLEAFEEEMHRATAALDSALAIVLSDESKTGRTTIFESLRVVQSLFERESRRKFLVVLSDMLEDSQSVNFDRTSDPGGQLEALLERQRASGALPRLNDVTTFAVGVLATPAAKAASLERFWRGYFDATGARIGPGNYTRVLLRFPQ